MRADSRGERTLSDARPVDSDTLEEMLRRWAQRIRSALPFEVDSWIGQLRQDARNFLKIYRTVSILPPDQYRSLVLQLTEGCSYNRCSFCQLYRDRPFRCKNPEEFQEHIGQVLHYFGAALPWRRGIFLGDANAASLSTDRLYTALEQIRRCFPCDLTDRSGSLRHPWQFDRVSCFQDLFSGKLRSLADWRELRRLGLEQVHLGIESGSKAVLSLLNKPLDPARLAELVSRLQQADIRVSLIFLLGAGGRELAQDHLKKTLQLLETLPLRGQDRVYLSDLWVHPNSAYQSMTRELGIHPLSRWECREQAQFLRQSLNYPAPPRGTAVALYDVRQFVYV